MFCSISWSFKGAFSASKESLDPVLAILQSDQASLPGKPSKGDGIEHRIWKYPELGREIDFSQQNSVRTDGESSQLLAAHLVSDITMWTEARGKTKQANKTNRSALSRTASLRDL